MGPTTKPDAEPQVAVEAALHALRTLVREETPLAAVRALRRKEATDIDLRAAHLLAQVALEEEARANARP